MAPVDAGFYAPQVIIILVVGEPVGKYDVQGGFKRVRLVGMGWKASEFALDGLR